MGHCDEKVTQNVSKMELILDSAFKTLPQPFYALWVAIGQQPVQEWTLARRHYYLSDDTKLCFITLN